MSPYQNGVWQNGQGKISEAVLASSIRGEDLDLVAGSNVADHEGHLT